MLLRLRGRHGRHAEDHKQIHDEMNVLRQEREDMQKAMDQQREMRDALMAERDSLRKEREDSRRMAADTRASIEVRPRLRERKTRSPMRKYNM